MSDQWVESKKEMDVDAEGKYTTTHITMEKVRPKILGFEKKDFWDQLIKSIGILAIAVPLILFKCSRDADMDKQKNIIQLDLYSNVLTDVQTIILMHDTSSEFKKAKQKLDIEYYSKMLIIGSDDLVSVYRELRDSINMFSLVAAANHVLDTVKKHFNALTKLCTSPQYRLNSYNIDSAVRRRTSLLSRSAIQWATLHNLISSLNKGDSTLNNVMGKTRGHLNEIEPLIRQQIPGEEKKINDSALNALTGLTMKFDKEFPACRQGSALNEKRLKGKLEEYFIKLNSIMKNNNKFLSRKLT